MHAGSMPLAFAQKFATEGTGVALEQCKKRNYLAQDENFDDVNTKCEKFKDKYASAFKAIPFE